LVSGGELDPELDARAAAEGIDERTAEELLLRLRERRIRRDLADADPARTLELQATLARIRAAIEELASAQPLSRRPTLWLPSSPCAMNRRSGKHFFGAMGSPSRISRDSWESRASTPTGC